MICQFGFFALIFYCCFMKEEKNKHKTTIICSQNSSLYILAIIKFRGKKNKVSIDYQLT